MDTAVSSDNVSFNKAVGHFKCSKGLAACKLTKEQKEFIHPRKGYTVKLKTFTNCEIKKLVYVAFCPCGLWYSDISTGIIKVRI